MKKVLKFFLILLIMCLNINVLATNDNNNIEQVEVSEEKENNDASTKDTNDDTNIENSTSKSSDATLSEVNINNEKVVCTLKDKVYVCEKLIKDNSINKVVITYKKNDSKASVSKEKIEEELKEGINEFKLEVVAEDAKTKQEYVFKITKEMLSTDSTLQKLVVNGEEIKLKEDTLKYQTTVSYSTKKLEIEAVPNDSKALISDFKDNKISYDFYDEKSEIKIKVEAEDGSMTTYVITVSKREEEDATLKSLKISNVSFDFESGVFDYEVTVLRNVDILEIEAVSTDSDADIKIDKPKKLEIGENIVKIEVSNDGNIKTYTIKVNKLDEEDKNLAKLETLKIKGYELDFKEDTYLYDLKIGDVNFLEIEALPKVEDAEVEITGNLDLVDGSIIKIKVIYDEETSSIYKINIIKEEIKEKDNNFLMYIIIGSSLLVLIVVIIIIIIIIKKKKNRNKKSDNKEEIKIEKNINKTDVISITSDEEIEDII